MKESQRLAAVLAFAVLAAGVLAWLVKDSLLPPATHAPGAAAGPAKPQAAAGPRVVRTRDGVSRDLASKTGKGLILHFWATWCPPCRDEMPELVKFVKETKSDANVEFLSVSVDEDWKVVDGWLKQNGISGLPVALDPRGATAHAFGTDKFPETYLISPAGEVVHYVAGMVDWSAPSFRTLAREFSRASGAQKAN